MLLVADELIFLILWVPELPPIVRPTHSPTVYSHEHLGYHMHDSMLQWFTHFLWYLCTCTLIIELLTSIQLGGRCRSSASHQHGAKQHSSLEFEKQWRGAFGLLKHSRTRVVAKQHPSFELGVHCRTRVGAKQHPIALKDVVLTLLLSLLPLRVALSVFGRWIIQFQDGSAYFAWLSWPQRSTPLFTRAPSLSASPPASISERLSGSRELLVRIVNNRKIKRKLSCKTPTNSSKTFRKPGGSQQMVQESRTIPNDPWTVANQLQLRPKRNSTQLDCKLIGTEQKPG